jgi:proline iminopeptidase
MPPARFLLCLTLITAAGVGCDQDPLSRLPVRREGTLPTTDGIVLAYRVIGGPGDTVLVIPGGPGLGSQYLQVALAPLATRHTLVFYDPRGRGNSDLPADTTRLGFAQDTSDLGAVRRFFHLGPVAIIAHHFGAVVAATYVTEHADAASRLLLLSPFFPRASYLFSASTLPNDTAATRRYLADLGAGLATRDPRGFCEKYWGFTFVPIEVTDPQVVRGLANVMCAAPPRNLQARQWITFRIRGTAGGADMTTILPRLSLPTLVMDGKSHPYMASSTRAWAAWTPGARLLIGPGPGLLPWYADSGAFRASVEEFLADRWPVGAAHPDSAATVAGGGVATTLDAQ